MQNSIPNNFVQQFPHLKSQWRSIVDSEQPDCFQNIYSQDLCQIQNGQKISMKELDLYAIRQGYSFPFCPKIYKYRIEKNIFEDRQIKFNVKILVEKVPFRLHKQITMQQRYILTNNLIQIAKGYEYLCKRYGYFHVKESMIGWTRLNIVKIWFNQDYSSNKITLPAQSQEETIESFLKILQTCKIYKVSLTKSYKSFQNLIQQIQKSETTVFSRQKSKQTGHFDKNSDCNSEYRMNQKEIQPKMRSIKRKFTFCFTNNEISSKKDVSSSKGKRNSISSHFKSRQNLAYDQKNSFHRKQPSVANDIQIQSLKVIRGNEKKKSYFYPNNITNKSMSIKQKEKRQNPFSRTFYQESTPVQNNGKTNSVNQSIGYRSSAAVESHQNIFYKPQKPQNLHNTTSTNPYSKLFYNKGFKPHEKSLSYASLSNKLNNQSLISYRNTQIKDEKPQQAPKVSLFNTFFQDVQNILIDQNDQNIMKCSQQVQKDLDALFQSTNEFDSRLLQRQLDKVLFQ